VICASKIFCIAAGLRYTASMPKSPTVRWTREHALIALNLYGKLQFGQFHHNNPVIIDVASRMGRSPSSLAMKLSNLASLDPVQRARGIKGLSGASKQDREMWNEFKSNLNDLGPVSEQLLHDLFTPDNDREVDFLARDKVRLERSSNLVAPSGSTESTASVKVRRGQQFFRQTILNAYGVRCCISGINVPRLLVASHIKRWAEHPAERLNPRNGLCLSNLHDAAFDEGLIALDEELSVILSKRLRAYFPQVVLEQNFVPFEGMPIRLPEKIAEPDPEFLRYHRKRVFKVD
jgi:putative restriction endonuclease